MTFSRRHIGPNSHETSEMLAALGVHTCDELLDAAIPAALRAGAPLALPAPLTEYQAQNRLREYAGRNIPLASFYGQGYNSTLVPAVLRQQILENPGWYTSYTPYQPEISQGRLEALLNFQTMVSELTGLPIANCSLLDEATAVAEAVALMHRKMRKASTVVLDARLHPQVRAVATERGRILGLKVRERDLSERCEFSDLAGVVIAYPGTQGDVADPEPVIAAAHEAGGLAAVAADPLALTLLPSPGCLGADVAVGTTQRFGIPLFFGGPHAAYMAVTDSLKRLIPGRLVGVSKDLDGRPAYRLALQTREQHIRRERATSNICTAQALLAIMAGMYAVYHGPDGLQTIARRLAGYAATFASALRGAGVDVIHEHFFDTVCARVPGKARQLVATALDAGYLLRAVDEDVVCVSFGEAATAADVERLCSFFGVAVDGSVAEAEPALLRLREDAPLRHPVFSSIHSETHMMRYLRRLEDRDLALDRTMIPLGSCTMKLNPAAALEPICYPGFADVHPFTPESHTTGWRALIEELEGWLAEITGYARVSVQPNAGSQGELAGLLAIRRYHVSRGDHQRDVCLVPASAHGTNAASAALANLSVVVVATADDGSIDLEDLSQRIEEFPDRIAAIMITYPSTHGVYEDTLSEVCRRVHEAGGQVYVDGANMNALAGIVRPGRCGGDVSHLNLHKTFAIPHGGGGPGVGPVCVASHLAEFLPADPMVPATERGAGLPVAGTRYGSAGVTPISWAYIAMMGADGLKEATAHAVLAANYVAACLEGAYPILYRGAGGYVAHECIVDLRELTEQSGVTALDVCKRLVDFGFHAPTLAFPVPGTLMVEPTESEDKVELDRFIHAMLTIRKEIQDIIDGTMKLEASVLRRSPFTAASVADDTWDEAFPRSQAAFPAPGLRRDKYFPASRRIDDAYGDRHLMCSCPPIVDERTDTSSEEKP